MRGVAQGHDVVDLRRARALAFAGVELTVGMQAQVTGANAQPVVVVATLGARAARLLVRGGVRTTATAEDGAVRTTRLETTAGG